ncbi:hypothetical protein BC936DRAFT_142036 [Jimgerdemannia flammicorona]|uniref:GDP-fucose protein O-fucosyltransferase-domain-containing protein n=1 Tax=Jimgerdemannia flammicorona TaxID=994334 RepID=A0A433A129_9FUNG|nr:hypothetical protein BC936DRAFT_142036 [Jimgerdemannia flammicorona]
MPPSSRLLLRASRGTRRCFYFAIVAITIIVFFYYALAPEDNNDVGPVMMGQAQNIQVQDDTIVNSPDESLFVNAVDPRRVPELKPGKYVPKIVGALDIGGSKEKYLTYLPHSGFSNQRTELVNALLMANYLNRTLIVPPAFLGDISGWREKSGLHAYWEKLTTGALEKICGGDAESINLINSHNPVTTNDCAAYKAYAMVPWSWLVDFGSLMPDIRVVERREISLPLLKQQLNLKDKDIYMVNEKSQYDWILYDKPSNFKHPKYRRSFSLDHFQHKSHRLIHLYSIFGSGRVRFTEEPHNKLREHIIRSLIYRHDVVESIAAQIVQQLGGHNNYLGLHIRTGHVLFQRVLKQTMTMLLKNLGKETGYAPKNDDDEAAGAAADLEIAALIDQSSRHDDDNDDRSDEPEFEPDHDPVGNQDAAVQLFQPGPFNKETPPIPLPTCVRLASRSRRGRHSLIFVATDSHNPRADPLISRLFRRYPCSFSLVDLDPDQQLLAPLRDVRSPLDPGKDLTKFLIPLVDAMIAAQGSRFFGSPGSTFSGYIAMVHRVEKARAKLKAKVNRTT